MPLNPQAVIMPPLQQVIFDKTLATLLAGGEVNFFEDSNRTIPKVVYELTGTGDGTYTYTSLGSSLTLSGIGSFVDLSGNNVAIYLWPYLGTPNDVPSSTTPDNYYITVYSATGVFQFDIPAWPGVVEGGSAENLTGATENIISNAQFTDVTFLPTSTSSAPTVLSISGVQTATEIAPNWFVVTTGTGTVSVYQQTITDVQAPGNPAYALGITTAGFSQPIILRQRLFTPRILAGQFVSATFIAESTTGSPVTITMNYTPSLTGTIQQLCTGTTSGSGFTTIANANPIEIINTGSGSGYVDITLVFPVSASLLLSCIQLSGTGSDTQTVSYIEETPEREIDHLFHYFQPQLNFKPIPSFLIGWDFPLNPAQGSNANRGVTAFTAGFANNAYYVWDQTIIYQSVDASVAALSNTNGDLVLTANQNTQIAIIQYLSAFSAQELFINYINNGLCSNVVMGSSVAQTLTVSLWYTTNASLPNINSNVCFVNSLDSNGHPNSVVGGWTELARGVLGNATFKTTPGVETNIQFSGWKGALSNVSSATFFAIVVGSSTLANTNNLSFRSVSLQAGFIPTIPAPQSPDEVFRQCQYYFETSDPTGNGVYFPMNSYVSIAGAPSSSNAYAYATSFELIFQQKKRVAPLLSITSSNAGTANNASIILSYSNGSSVFTSTSPTDTVVLGAMSSWNAPVITTTNALFYPNTNVALKTSTPISISNFYSSSVISFNYLLNSRLGAV